MRFSKIGITKRGVHLTRETKDENGAVESIDLESPERPLTEFSDALQAFKPYVRDLMPFGLSDDQLTITTLSLSEDKNGLRGLIVSAVVPIPKAYDKPVVLNTPLVREGGENASEEAFVLSDEVLELIDLAETEATRYANGERIQGELFTKSERSAEATTPMSENEREFNERAASAEVASTRKPRRGRGKGKAFIPGVGDVVNPNASEPPTDEQLRELLQRAGRDAPVDALHALASSERDALQRWADAMLDPMTMVSDIPAEPEILALIAMLPLNDSWSDPPHRRVTEDDAQSILAAKESGE
jgi:hypothetical protein